MRVVINGHEATADELEAAKVLEALIAEYAFAPEWAEFWDDVFLHEVAFGSAPAWMEERAAELVEKIRLRLEKESRSSSDSSL